MEGYKVFEPDWTCRGFQYEVGKTFEEDVIPSCCSKGFHFCKELKDCFNYYPFNPDNKVAKVVALGELDEESDGSKCCTNKIQIVEEISWEDVLRMVNLEKETQVFATAVIGTAVIGTAVIATAVIGTILTFQMDVLIHKNLKSYCSINLQIGHIVIG